jgi:hypothetical protein
VLRHEVAILPVRLADKQLVPASGAGRGVHAIARNTAAGNAHMHSRLAIQLCRCRVRQSS